MQRGQAGGPQGPLRHLHCHTGTELAMRGRRLPPPHTDSPRAASSHLLWCPLRPHFPGLLPPQGTGAVPTRKPLLLRAGLR